jgi:hypothetical protein
LEEFFKSEIKKVFVVISSFEESRAKIVYIKDLIIEEIK